MADQTNYTPPEPTKGPLAEKSTEVRHTAPYATHRSRFDLGSFFFGLVVLAVGLIFLLQSFGVIDRIDFDWWQLWPLILVFIGLSILSRGGWVANLIGGIVTLAVLALVASIIIDRPPAFLPQQEEAEVHSQEISVSRDQSAQRAAVEIDHGAGNLDIAGGSAMLVTGELKSTFTNLDTASSVSDGVQAVRISQDGDWRGFGRHTNDLRLALSNDVPMRLDIDSGAADINADLREVRLTELVIDTGASSVEVELGDKVDVLTGTVKAGASSLEISLPRSVGARIVVRGGLSSKDLPEFTQVGENTYESANYQSSPKKVNLELEIGVSSLDVRWR